MDSDGIAKMDQVSFKANLWKRTLTVTLTLTRTLTTTLTLTRTVTPNLVPNPTLTLTLGGAP